MDSMWTKTKFYCFTVFNLTATNTENCSYTCYRYVALSLIFKRNARADHMEFFTPVLAHTAFVHRIRQNRETFKFFVAALKLQFTAETFNSEDLEKLSQVSTMSKLQHKW